MQEIIIGSIPLIIAFLVILVRYKKLEPPWLRLFAWFLLGTFIFQTAGFLYSLTLKKSNHFIFNAYTSYEYAFYMYVLYHALRKTKFKTTIGWLCVLFLLVYIYEVMIKGSFFVYSPIAVNTGKFFILIGCLLYFSELLMAEMMISFFRLPLFWIFSGVMFAAVGNFLYLCFFDYIVHNDIDKDGQIYGLISTITTVVEYGFFIVGFLVKGNE